MQLIYTHTFKSWIHLLLKRFHFFLSFFWPVNFGLVISQCTMLSKNVEYQTPMLIKSQVVVPNFNLLTRHILKFSLTFNLLTWHETYAQYQINFLKAYNVRIKICICVDLNSSAFICSLFSSCVCILRIITFNIASKQISFWNKLPISLYNTV